MLLLNFTNLNLFKIGDNAPSNLPEEPIPTLSWPPENFDPTSGDEDSLMGLGKGTPGTSTSSHMPSTPVIVTDPTERRQNAMAALKLMCDSPVLAPFLREMLSAKLVNSKVLFLMAILILLIFLGMLKDKHHLC